MKLLKILSILLPALFMCGAVNAAIVEGNLELQWGDPERGKAVSALFRATLVADDGTRYALAQARRAAGF